MSEETAHILQVVTEIRDNASAGLKAVGDAGGAMGRTVSAGATTATTAVNETAVAVKTTERVTLTAEQEAKAYDAALRKMALAARLAANAERQQATALQETAAASHVATQAEHEHAKASHGHGIPTRALAKDAKEAAKGFLLMGGAAESAASGVSGLLSAGIRGFAHGGLFGLGLGAGAKLIELFGEATHKAREELEKFGEKAKENLEHAKESAHEAEKDVAMLEASLKAKGKGADPEEAARAEAHKYDAMKRNEEVQKDIEESKRAEHDLGMLIEDDYEGWIFAAQKLSGESRKTVLEAQHLADEYHHGKITMEELAKRTVDLVHHNKEVGAVIGEEIVHGMEAYLTNTQAIGELNKRNAAEEKKYALEREMREKEREERAEKEKRRVEKLTEEVRDLTYRIQMRATVEAGVLKDLENEWAIEDEINKLLKENVDSQVAYERGRAMAADFARKEADAEEKIAEAKEKAKEAGLKAIENEIRKNTLTKEALTLAEREDKYWEILWEFGREVADKWLDSISHLEKMTTQTEILTKAQKEYEENVKEAAKAHEKTKEANIDIILQISKMQAEIDGGVQGLKEWERTTERIKMQNDNIEQRFIDQYFALKDILAVKKDITEAEEMLKDATEDTTESDKKTKDKGDKGDKDKDKSKRRKTGGIFGVTFDDPRRQGGLANTLRRRDEDEDSPTHKAAKKTADAAGKAADKGKEKDAEAAKKMDEAGKKIHALSEQLEKGQITAEKFQAEVAETLKAFKDIQVKGQEATNKKIAELKDIVATLKKALDGLTKGTGKK